MKTEQPKEKEPVTRLNNHLGPLADKILSTLRKHGPLNDLQLDGVFTRKVAMPERINVLQALEAVKLIRHQPTNGGGNLWIPCKITDTNTTTKATVTDATTVKVNTQENENERKPS